MMHYKTLAPRARFLMHLQALLRFFLFSVPFALFLGGLLAVFWSPLWASIATALLLLCQFMIALWMPSFAFDRWGYCLRERDLLIRSGVIFHRLTSIPMHRVQHVDTRQGPFEQWMGLARVHISTASGLGVDGVIPGLEVAVAEALRDRLVARCHEGDDGV